MKALSLIVAALALSAPMAHAESKANLDSFNQAKLGESTVYRLPHISDGKSLFFVTSDSAPNAVCRHLGHKLATAVDFTLDLSFTTNPKGITVSPDDNIAKVISPLPKDVYVIEYIACE